MSRDAISSRQFGHLFSQGGFSVNTQTGESPTSGYMVALQGSERSIPSATIHPHDLHSYAREHSRDLQGPNRYFGGWNDTSRGAVDLDTSVNMPSGGPIERAGADVAMIRHGQRSMYDVGADTVVSNQFHGLSVPEAHGEIKRRYEQSAGERR